MTREIMAFGALKGSPGVTTLALALAAAWPPDAAHGRPIVVEADASGGDLAVRFGLSDMTGLLALAAEARRAGPASQLTACAQEIVSGVLAVAAPTGADQARASVEELAARVPVLKGSEEQSGTVLLDLGHLGAAPSRALAAAADRLVVVAQGGADALAHVAARPGWLSAERVDLVVIGACPYSTSEIAKALDLEEPCVHLLPWDERAGRALRGEARVGQRRWGRSPLARGAARLARQLAGIEAQSAYGGLAGELAQLTARSVTRPALEAAGESGPL
ncbi:hypothetical protein [Streptomyces triticagri]|uniref:hypothetical protein n=1 Tax=Streptomyces triticagri TaxID=2293568 RepID=UPI001F2781F8|nr:hypothetical protein [Streptomyces triticagri]